jgi:cell division protein FtsQ
MKITADHQSDWFKFERLFGLLLAIMALLIFLNSRLFAVKSITVTGNSRLTDTEIILGSGIHLNQSIFMVRGRRIEAGLKKYPWLAEVRTVKKYPDTVELLVRERVPFGVLTYHGNGLLIAEDGMILQLVDDDQQTPLPRITGIKLGAVKIGRMIADPDLATAIRILKLAGPQIAKAILEVNMADYTLQYRHPKRKEVLAVLLGDAQELERKIYNLKAILTHLSEALVEIDLRSPDLPTVLTPRAN